MRSQVHIIGLAAMMLHVGCSNMPSATAPDSDGLPENVDVCHPGADEGFALVTTADSDYQSHVDHGDARVGGPVPGTDGYLFDSTCRVVMDESCPSGMAHVEGFCIDRWEAHLQAWSPYEVPFGGIAATAPGVIPQAYISGIVAAEVCHAAGKRLCTSDEWLRACQGPMGTTYPYGDVYDPNACNDSRDTHPVIDLFGANTVWSSEQMNDPRLNQLPSSLDSTGSNPGCVSAGGVYDLHGNLHEWVADAEGTFRGGFYVDAVINGNGCSYVTTAHTTAYHDYSTGFRCCADPP